MKLIEPPVTSPPTASTMPMMKPPISAPAKLPMLPSTTTMNAVRVKLEPTLGLT